MSGISTRPYRPADRDAVLGFLAAFQDFERQLHSSRRAGAGVAAPYLAQITRKAAARSGALFVAEYDGDIAGLVVCWAEHDDDVTLVEGARRFGYVSDIFVAPGHRGRGVGAALLAAAEGHLAGLGLSHVQLHVLAANADARAVYERSGYRAYEIIYEKSLVGGAGHES